MKARRHRKEVSTRGAAPIDDCADAILDDQNVEVQQIAMDQVAVLRDSVHQTFELLKSAIEWLRSRR
jgi:hypothetical protein